MSRDPANGGPVVACVRVADLHPVVDPLTGAVRTEPAGLGLADAEAAAVEHALRCGERWGARVSVVVHGPRSVEPAMRELSAHGVDVLRVEDDDTPSGERLAGDEHASARSVAAAVDEVFGPPRLVVCADRSSDRGTGAFPAFLAHELGAAQALGLVGLSVPEDGDHVVAERRLDGGWRERLRVPLPAVCSVEAAGVRLRRATLEPALAASGRSVPVVNTSTTGGARRREPRMVVGAQRPFVPRPRVVAPPEGDDPRRRVLELCGALEQREAPVVLGPLPPDLAADELLAFLDRHGYRHAEDGGAAKVEGG